MLLKINFKKGQKYIRIACFITIFIILSICLININNIVGFYPSKEYLKRCAILSIKEANDFNWSSYKGDEGSELFTNRLKKELFGKAVDLNYIKRFQVVSEGSIERFIEIDTVHHSISFIADRRIKDKDLTREFKTEFTYKFKFEGYHWLINEVSFKRL